MGQDERWHQRPQWLDDARGEPRWCELRTALAKLGGEEYLGKVRDLSLSGLGLALRGARARRGQGVRLAVVFEGQVVEVSGTVAHAESRPWGSLVGVAYDRLAEETREFLRERYEGASALGSVK